jgi:hypothetical protein
MFVTYLSLVRRKDLMIFCSVISSDLHVIVFARIGCLLHVVFAELVFLIFLVYVVNQSSTGRLDF